ncbi:MAG: glycosyltransferase family 4 protein [Candidatus Omnitrophota bacterium]
MAELELFKSKKMNIHIIANSAALDKKFAALSGGDRIYIELARAWAAQGHLIDIYAWEEGLEMCRDRYDLKGVNFHLWSAGIVRGMPFAVGYLYRIFSGLVYSLRLKIPEGALIYSASDFWQDFIPAMILKLRNKNVKWIAGFYMFAPRFWQKDSPYKGRRFIIGLFYWLSQLPVYYLIKRYADMVFVTSEPDAKRFLSRQRGADRTVVVRGGVNLKPSREYLSSEKAIPQAEKKYDACFVGRFHPQKGVLELVDIWKLVCRQNPKAKLVMIGSGGLEREVKNKISQLQLNENIDLAGFKDGEPKYEIFRNSKIVVHPAIYDSGGMAAAEAMAWGLPGVSFDLEALKTYYPKGMIKVKCFDLQEFAKTIIKLLQEEKLYTQVSKEGLELVREEWDWSKRSEMIYERIMKGLMQA